MVQGGNQNQFVGADRQILEILCDILRNKDTVQFFFAKLFRQVLKSVNIEPKFGYSAEKFFSTPGSQL